VWNCLIFFLGEYSSVWPEICRVLSQTQWRFLRGISGNNHFERFFQKFFAKQNLWNFALLSAIFFRVRIALKKFTQVLSYVVCTQLRRHDHNQITKGDIGKKNSGHIGLEKLVLFSLGLIRITPYSFGVLVWNFFQRFVIVFIVFWMRFKFQIGPTRFTINILFITGVAKRFVCMWNYLIFFLVEYSFVDLKFIMFCFKFSRYSYIIFGK